MLTDANRAIRLRLATADGVVDDLLLIKYISGKESMCGGLEYVLRCVSSKAGMELKKFIANPVEVQFVTDTGKLRSVCGIISAVTEGQNDGGLASYELVMHDVLSLMEQTCNTRVFRNCSEIDITETLLKEWIQNNPIVANAFRFEFKGLKTYPSREFTMQFNESTSAFLRRLWRRRGISWFIQSQISSERGSREIPHHTLVLFDDSDKLAANPAGPARYHRDDGTEQRDRRDFSNTITLLDRAKIFHAKIGDTYHDESYAHYGVDSDKKAWHKVVWEAGENFEINEVDSLILIEDNKKGDLELIQPAILKLEGPSASVDVKMLDAAEPGDETVPSHSADAQLLSKKFKAIFRQTGYEHQESYSDSSAIASTMYSLFKIISNMKWSKL